jgi:pilus assembly protein Flp/PilA
MRTLIGRLLRNRSGATAIEYGLIAALIGLTVMVGFSTMANSIASTFLTQGETVNDAWSSRQ